MKKMHKIILIIVGCCFLIACGASVEEKPIADKSEGYYHIRGSEGNDVSIKFNLENKRFVLLWKWKQEWAVGVYGDFEVQEDQIIAYAYDETEKYVFSILDEEKIRFMPDESIDTVSIFENDMVLTYQLFETGYSEEYGYPNADNYDGWNELDVCEKIEICRIPETILNNMSDEELIASVFEFPFSDIFVYDHLEQGVKVLEDTSDAYAELVSRETGLESLLNYVKDSKRENEYQDDLVAAMILYQEDFQDKLSDEEIEMVKSFSSMIQNY